MIVVTDFQHTKGCFSSSAASDLDHSGYSESTWYIVGTKLDNKLKDSLTEHEKDEIENLICEYFQGGYYG